VFTVYEKVLRCLQSITITKAFSFVVFAYSLRKLLKKAFS
jgi:hypothetical protein